MARLLHHGWFVVRNKTKHDETDPDFDLQSTEGALFGKQPWTKIRETRRGSGMLKKYLGKLLCEKIQVAFPTLLDNLRRQLKEAQTTERNLGPARDSGHQRRAYLTQIAQRYQAHAREALERPWLLNSPSSRARQIVREANDAFSDEMRETGHQHSFQDQGLEMDGCLERLGSILLPDNNPPTVQTAHSATEDEDEGDNGESLFDRIKEEVAICSSTQLPGMVHPDVIQRLYKEQTSLWHGLASDHVRQIANTILSTSEELLNLACPASGSTSFLHGELLLAVRQFHDESLEKVLYALEKYCDGDQTKLLQTTDPGFIRRLQVLRSLRMVKTMELATTLVSVNRKTHSVEELGILLFEHCHHSAVDNTVNDVHDTLKVYYEVSDWSDSYTVPTN